MSMRDDDRNPRFTTTRWSVVLRAGGHGEEAGQAMAELCQRYWFPLYSYARRHGRSAADAEDGVQAFFALVLERELFASADPQKGRLRTYLLTAFSRHLRDEHARDTALKRGGQQRALSIDTADAEARYHMEPADRATPEQMFERRWAMSILEQTMQRVAESYATAGNAAAFDALRPTLENPLSPIDYKSLAASLGSSEGAARVAVHRLRQRFGDRLREIIRDTVEDDEAVEAELQYLQEVLGTRQA